MNRTLISFIVAAELARRNPARYGSLFDQAAFALANQKASHHG